MNALDAVHYTIKQLSKHFPKGEARSLSRIVFEDHFDLYPPYGEKEFSAEKQKQLEAIIGEIIKGVPVQYLVAKTQFYGSFFKVSPAVLIPRPETEELVHLILEQFASRKDLIGLDIGTGTGCIPLSLKKKKPTWQLYASDISEDALRVASENAMRHQVDIHFHQFDILKKETYPKALPLFDFIVSNPPYIAPSEKNALPANVLQHEPAIALFTPQEDALVFYRQIVAFAKRYLRNGGYLFFECSEYHAAEVAELLERHTFANVYIRKDMQGKERMVFGQFVIRNW